MPTLKAESVKFHIRLSSTVNAQLLRPLRDDHPCYRLVGLIAAEAARIERMIDQSICNVANIDLKVGASITGQMIGPTPRFNALLQLSNERGVSSTIMKRIKTMSGRASGHFERRNRAVHDPWMEDADSGETHQFRGKAKADPTFGPTPVSEQELKNILTELRKHRDEVSQLTSDIWTELRPAS